MPVVKTFSASEEAYVAAATLESAGIEATVIDHSSFDSSLLGATSGVDALAIEVADDDVEKATQLLTAEDASSETDAAPNDAASEPGPEWPLGSQGRLKEMFRTLLVVEIVVIAASVAFRPALYHEIPDEFVTFIVSKVPSEGLWDVAANVSNGFLLMCILANVLLFQFMRLGRVLYVANTAWWAITYLAYPPELRTPLGELVNSLEWALAGAIIALMWLPPLSKQFRRKPTG